MPQEPLRLVIVTGGAGYIGSHVVLTLLETRRYRVVSLDNYSNSFPEALVRVSEIARESLPADASEQDKESTKVDAVSCDLTRDDQVRAVFERYGHGAFWGVIHIAALKSVGESSSRPLDYYQANVGATVNLLKIADEYGCHRFVYSSSATVYGIPPVIPIPETTPLIAESVYGRTKVFCEHVLMDLAASAPEKWRLISLRYFNPAGAHPSGRIGEDPRGRPGNLLPLLAHMAVGRLPEGRTLQVFGNDYPTRDGTCVRDYIHVLDLASGHVLALDALDSPNDPRAFRAYNLGKGRGQSVLDMVEAMRKASGCEYETVIVGRRKGDVPDLTADPALAEKELGFKAPRELDEMCRDLWNWQSKNPQGFETPQAAAEKATKEEQAAEGQVATETL